MLRTVGGISLSFWLVCLFSLKLNAIPQLKGEGSQPQGLGVGGSGNFSRIGEFLWYEEGEGALYRGQVLS